MKDYILVTACKNEEESLPKLIESVVDQTLRPKIWAIVDDGSTDKTSEILKKISVNNEWIRIIKLSEKPRDLGIHIAFVYQTGFNYAIDYCMNNSINYEYIGLVDADIILDNTYFESLINKFDQNQNLGICSGHVGNIVNDEIIWSEFKDDLPTGGARIWRKKCFEDTQGYQLTCSPDSVSNVKAKINGWEIRQYEQVKVISTRPYASAEGQWKGYKKLGANNYYIGYTSIHIILKGVKLLYSKNKFYKTGAGIPYILGYFTELIKRSPRINDKEVLEYYQKKRMSEILFSKLKFQRNVK